MKKIILTIALVSFLTPQFVRAIPVEDVANTAQTTISAGANSVTSGATTASSISTTMLQIKEYILDNAAFMLAKAALRQLTTSIVTWINSGFQGNPGFVANPAEFFKEIGNQAIGDMIMDQGSLAFLCTPFSIDLRLQLAFKYSPFQKRISCTLTDVINNTTGALGNASINGFTAGDFAQGGWPAFVEMTTAPQNNLYGAYVQADFELSARMSSLEERKSNELNQGRGFLSWRKCTTDPDALAVEAELDDALSENPTYSGAEANSQYAQERDDNCDIYTPGSVIAGVIDANTTGPLQELHLADEINEIVGALFSQLVKKTLTAGLRGLSQGSATDPQSYVQKLQAENDQLYGGQLKAIKDNILLNIDKYIKKELDFKLIKSSTLKLHLDAKAKFDTAKSCFIGKQQTLQLTEAQVAYANERIGAIEGIIQNKISATTTEITGEIAASDASTALLQDVKQKTIAADTINKISDPSTRYATAVSSAHTDKDILDANRQKEQATLSIEAINNSADFYINSCNAFPTSVRVINPRVR